MFVKVIDQLVECACAEGWRGETEQVFRGFLELAKARFSLSAPGRYDAVHPGGIDHLSKVVMGTKPEEQESAPQSGSRSGIGCLNPEARRAESRRTQYLQGVRLCRSQTRNGARDE